MNYKLIIASLALFAVVSCSEDDMKGYVPDGEAITIVRNDLLFPAQGSTATVEVRANGALTAETDADWASAKVEGSIVEVSVETNTHYEGRTAMLTLRSGQDYRMLPIQQRGVIVGTMPVKSVAASMSGQSFSYSVVHDLPMTFSSTQSWIHAAIEGELLTITVDANSGGELRRGMVVSECNGLRDTLSVVQYDLQNHVLGSYYMMGYSGGIGGAPVAARMNIVEHDGEICLHWPAQDLWKDTFLPLSFDASTCTLFIPSALHFYESGNNYDYGYFYDSNGVVAGSNRMGANARLLWDSAEQSTYAPLTAANWPGHELSGFIVRSSRGGGLVVTNLLQIAKPILLRLGPPEQ